MGHGGKIVMRGAEEVNFNEMFLFTSHNMIFEVDINFIFNLDVFFL